MIYLIEKYYFITHIKTSFVKRNHNFKAIPKVIGVWSIQNKFSTSEMISRSLGNILEPIESDNMHKVNF